MSRLSIDPGVVPDSLYTVIAETLYGVDQALLSDTKLSVHVLASMTVAKYEDLHPDIREAYRVKAGAILQRIAPLIGLFVVYHSLNGYWYVGHMVDAGHTPYKYETKERAMEVAKSKNEEILRRSQLLR